MELSKIPPGRNPSDEIHVLVEIPQGGVPIKYELDKTSGALFVNPDLFARQALLRNRGCIGECLRL